MWAFNQDQSANNNQQPNLGWNVGNANAGGGKNRDFHETATYVHVFISSSYSAVGSSNLGWSVGAPVQPPMPYPSMPHPPIHHHPSSSSYDDGEPGIDESFSAKNAGAMSFAHYIVKWVSVEWFTIIVCSSPNCHESCWFLSSRLLLSLSSRFSLFAHIHRNCVIGVRDYSHATTERTTTNLCMLLSEVLTQIRLSVAEKT